MIGVGLAAGLGSLSGPTVGLTAYFVLAGLAGFLAFCTWTPNWRRRWRQGIVPAIECPLLVWFVPYCNWIVIALLVLDLALVVLFFLFALGTHRSGNQDSAPRPQDLLQGGEDGHSQEGEAPSGP